MSMIRSDEADHTNDCRNKGSPICAASKRSRLEPKQTCPQTGIELLQQVALLGGKTKSTCMKSETETAEPKWLELCTNNEGPNMTLPSTEILLSPKLNLPKTDKARPVRQKHCADIENPSLRRSNAGDAKPRQPEDLGDIGESRRAKSDRSEDGSRFRALRSGIGELHQVKLCIEIKKSKCRKSGADTQESM